MQPPSVNLSLSQMPKGEPLVVNIAFAQSCDIDEDGVSSSVNREVNV